MLTKAPEQVIWCANNVPLLIQVIQEETRIYMIGPKEMQVLDLDKQKQTWTSQKNFA